MTDSFRIQVEIFKGFKFSDIIFKILQTFICGSASISQSTNFLKKATYK